MKFVLMNQFVPPARAPTGVLLHDLAETLRARGHQVELICSGHRYGRATGVVSKLVEYIAYTFYAHRTLLRMNPPPDAVVSMTTPPFLGLTAAALKKKKGIPFMLWCMDLYPEALVAGGLLKHNSFVYRLLSRLTVAERRDAACVVTLGPDMTRCRKTEAVLEVPVWSRLELTPDAEVAGRELRRQRGWGDDETICLYSGNMGRAHRVDEFAALAGLSIPKTRFVFCGVGPQKKEWKEKHGDLFEWLDPVADDQLAAHLLSADIHLISQQPEWVGVVVPSKYQAACALGRPVLFAGPANSAVAGWIRQFENGWVLPPCDVTAIEKVTGELARPPAVLLNPFEAEPLKNRLADRLEQIGAVR